ncbi:hypothetical protein MGYG_06732 [Nannizzia gypsea CBS 118893]|uniref:54S ribosomal protein L11 n=1 Tax=Arthroderma gypseum (strain ATCC MYA-4604 / CBS 118893) TaxID=535722 RepID=E4V119_ARTGP|nr:hypothetical protein MGYG_06732 [Nannizzia gypsea CBS 118893]EFR03734.1 hypothetical protein MGYG_06732 [Nannizzia gypsea CBS 118893]
MPPRIHLQSLARRSRTPHTLLQHELQSITASLSAITRSRSMASVAPAATATSMSSEALQPLSHRRPEYRKSQLHRQYASILRTMPLIIYFQHNNLQSTEWANIRRELIKALRKVDEKNAAIGSSEPAIADSIKLQIIQTSIYEAAMRVVDFYRPDAAAVGGQGPILDKEDPRLTHDLSYSAYRAVLPKRGQHDFSTLLVGPIATLSFPSVSPDHLRAAFSILAPTGKNGLFPPPARKANPGLYDLTTQSGLQKLMLLGARVEGKVFDADETKWVGSIEGGLGGLRAQLVGMLQGVSSGLARTLESAGNNLYLTLESRRSVLEEEQNGGKKEEQAEQK